MINHCNDILEKRKRTVAMELLPETGVWEKQYNEIEWRHMMNQLAEEYRTILILYYLEQMTVKEIADLLEMKENTVKSRLQRGRKQLLLVAALTVLVGGTVYALQTSWFAKLAQGQEDTYAMLDETGADNFSEEYQKILEDQKVQTMQQAQRYQKMAEVSDKEQETFELRELIGNSVVKEESYYDGTDFALLVDLKTVSYPVEYDFGPGSEGFDQRWNNLKSALPIMKDHMEEEGISEEERKHWEEVYRLIETQIANYDETLDEVLSQYISEGYMTEQEFTKIKETYEKNGTVGFICYKVGIGDHILMADGSDLTVNCGEAIDGRYLFQPYEGMPQKACGLEKLDVVLQVKKYKHCMYVDEQGFLYQYCPVAEPELVTITLENAA